MDGLRCQPNDKPSENSFFPNTRWKLKFENDRSALLLKTKTWQSAKQFVNQNHAWKRMEMCDAPSKCVKKVLGMLSRGNETFINFKIEGDLPYESHIMNL